MLARRIERREDDLSSSQVIDRETLLAMQAAVELVHVDPSRRALHRRPRRGDAREHEPRRRREPARQPRAAQALPLPGRARRPRLRHARRREGDRRARARASALLKPELWVQRRSGEDVVRDTLEQVPTPPAEDVGTPAA